MLTAFSPDEIYQAVITTGQEWAEADAKANLLEETRKVVESTLTQSYLAQGDSAAAARVKALASPDYRTHVEGMVVAREFANRAKVKYQATVELSHNRRTQAVNEREQIKIT